MGEIRVLDKHIAELIAAGEVVDRPASIVKELLENSIDAGSTHITVEIKRGGIDFIRVSDDGKGISPDDAETAFLRHATSKIKNADDLNAIFTLGFRGEALASICAVSRVTMMTRQSQNDFGCTINVEGGSIISKEDSGCPVGTTIIVRDVFFNTPARMKFLKKDVSEANAVASVVEKIAISNPQISFKFIRDGRIEIQTPGDNKLISSIYCVLGKQFADSLIEVDLEKNGVNIKGFISKPIYSRAKRGMQYFFLNGRTIKSPTATVALEEAYKGSIMVGKFPACVLNIEVSPSIVDVNVHPAKTEVRFSDENVIYDTVYFACKSALAKDAEGSSLSEINNASQKNTYAYQNVVKDKNFTDKSEQFSFIKQPQKEEIKKPQIKINTYNQNNEEKPKPQEKSSTFINLFTSQDINEEENIIVKNNSSNLDKNKEIIATVVTPRMFEKITEKDTVTPSPIKEQIEVKKADIFDNAKVIGELFKTYIMLECDSALYLIDKHAAHERIIYNKLKESRGKSAEKQFLLEPLVIRLSREEYDAVIKNISLVNELGFDADDFGNGTIIVRAVPSFILQSDIEGVISEIAINLCDGKKDVSPQIIDNIYHSMACRAAVKANDKSAGFELELLVEIVRQDSDVRYCPHGRPVSAKISKHEIERRFGRIQ